MSDFISAPLRILLSQTASTRNFVLVLSTLEYSFGIEMTSDTYLVQS